MLSSAQRFSHFNLADPDRYAAEGYPDELWTWMRREDPVALVE